MPHKRAKQSARLENRKKMQVVLLSICHGYANGPVRGQNLAPGKDDGMSRRMREVLFGEQIRAELKQRKRSRDGADDEDEGNRSRKKGRTQSGDKEEELRIKVRIARMTACDMPTESKRTSNSRGSLRGHSVGTS